MGHQLFLACYTHIHTLHHMWPDLRKLTTLSHLTSEIFMAKTKHFATQINASVSTALVYMMNYQKSYEILLNPHVCFCNNRVKCLVLFISCVTKWMIFQNPVTYLHVIEKTIATCYHVNRVHIHYIAISFPVWQKGLRYIGRKSQKNYMVTL